MTEMNPLKSLGILGGTFDPIHHGHLRIALEMAETLNISKVHLIPSYLPVHREPTKASSQARFEMVKLGIQNNPLFVADNREILRAKPSYTIDSLLSLREEFPDKALCLFLGFDAFLGFHTWQRYQDILDLAHLVIARRSYETAEIPAPINDLMAARTQQNYDYIQSHKAGGLFFPPTTLLDISAKDIRKQIAMKRNPMYLLPDNVFNYIQLNGIYQQ